MERDEDFFEFEELEGFEEVEEGGEGSELVTESEILCPHCGEVNAITLDPGGGGEQRYVEDCQVCCRPWLVHVQYDEQGTVQVWVEAAYE